MCEDDEGAFCNDASVYLLQVCSSSPALACSVRVMSSGPLLLQGVWGFSTLRQRRSGGGCLGVGSGAEGLEGVGCAVA